LITTHHRTITSTFAPAMLRTPIVANDAGCSLREAIARDHSGGDELSLASLWRELANGSCQIVDAFFTKHRCYLVTRPTELGPLSPRGLGILQAVLGGCAQKNLSFDLDLSPSAVTVSASQTLAGMGLTEKPLRTHALLILAARAAAEQDEALSGRSSFLVHGNRHFRAVSVARPESCLLKRLPAAELDVVRCLVEGRSHADTARIRGTSPRTIANQIASVFRRLGVSCRIELVNRLFTWCEMGLPLAP
jgi:DNA-binding NarL/FixJ family response regulator